MQSFDGVSLVLKKALKLVKPSKAFEKELLEICNDFLKKVSLAAKSLNINASFHIGGSVAKGTFLKTINDVDVFAAFDLSYEDQNISELLEQVLKASKIKYVKIHGSRDYFQTVFQGLTFEIVPVLRINDWVQARNMTDVSLLHVSWVEKHLKANPGLADEIRVAKQFCKACKCYGAESFVKGFSGHLLDILVIYYKGFKNLLEASQSWEAFKTIIDPENNFDEYKKVMQRMALTPLIVIEPVHPHRNAAAALSLEKFERFKLKAKLFLKNPSLEFFKVKPLTVNSFAEEFNLGDVKVLELKVKGLKANPDVSGAKVLKIFEYLAKQLEMHDFKVIAKDWEFSKSKLEALLLYALPLKQLSERVVVKGPPVKALKHVDRFKLKHASHDVFEKNGRLFAVVKRKFTKPEELVAKLIQEEYVREKCSEIQLQVHVYSPSNSSV